MVAAVSGSGLGLSGLSGNVLGGAGVQGEPAFGRGTDRIYVNAATGNLIIQSREERLNALGLDLSLVRTYNSQGLFDDDNGDNWRLGVHQRVYGLVGTVNTAGSTVRKVGGDGRDVLYQYNTTRARYESTDGDGAHDVLGFDATRAEWTWAEHGAPDLRETYSSAGQLLSARDADGNTVTYGYTGALLTSITDASNQVTTFVYSGDNLTEIRVVSNGVTQTLTRYTYDASNRLRTARVDLSPDDNSIADERVYTSTYTYDGDSHRVAEVTQSDGSSVSFTYQSLNGQFRVATYTVANAGGNRTITFTYTNFSSAGAVYQQTDVRDAMNLVTTHIHDSTGRLTGVLSPAVGGARLETRYDYDDQGNVIRVTEDPTGLNRQTVHTYDDRGNLLTTRDSLGNTVSLTYSANNQLLTETAYVVRDPDGEGSQTASAPLTTRYAYDSESHLRFVVTADGTVTEHRYNALGQRVVTFNYAGTSAFYTAEAFGESDLASWATAQDLTRLERTDYAYDFRGNLSIVTGWNLTTATGEGNSGTSNVDLNEPPNTRRPSITHFIYDQRGQLLRTTTPNGNLAFDRGANDHSTMFTYDGLGRLLTRTEWGSFIMRPALVISSTVMSYDDVNRRTVTTQGNGLVSTSLYSQAGELLSVVNGAAGELGSTTYTYDPSGRLRMVTDPTGVRTFHFYDAAGRKVACVDGDGSLIEYVYDRASQLIKTVEYAGRINSTTLATLVDASGNPVDVSLANLRSGAGGNSAQDRVTRSVYNAAGQLVYTIAADGAPIEHRYDGAGRLTDTIAYYNRISIDRAIDEVLPSAVSVTPHANDRRTRLFYTNDGQLAGMLDPEGYLAEKVYGASGLLIREIAYANQTAAGVRATGTLAELKSSAGTDDETQLDPERDSQTRYFYDGQRKLQASFDPEGYLSDIWYDLSGNVTLRTRWDKVLTWSDTATYLSLRAQVPSTTVKDRTSYNYDGGLLVGEQRTRGAQLASVVSSVRYTYDLAGNVLSVARLSSSGDDRTTETRYDALGRVKQQLSAQGRALITGTMTQAQIDAIWNQYGVAYTYDLAGRRTSVTARPNDAQTNTTLYYYDDDGRLRFEIDQLGGRIERRYDPLGQLTDEIHYSNRIATSGLSGGLLTSELITTLSANASANDAHAIYAYTLTGQVASKRVLKTSDAAQDGLTAYNYDAFGQVEAMTEAIDATRTLRHEYSHDKRGLLTLTRWDAVTGGLNTTESRTYDAFGRLSSVTDARGNVVNRYEYDRLGRQIVTTDSSADDRTITTYDAFSRVRTVKDALNNTTLYTYDDQFRRMTVRPPDGVIVITTFGLDGEQVSVTAAGNTTSYTYDRNGRVTKVSDTLGTLETRKYDRQGRLIAQTDARGIVTTLDYDAANHVLTRTEDSATGGLTLVTTYQYDGQGRVTSVQTPNGVITETSYDAAGRITQIAVDPAGQNRRTVYEYDRQDREVTVTEAFGSAQSRRTKYVYDALGRRIEEILDPISLGGTLNQRTQYRYDANGNLTRRIDARGNSTWYVYDVDDRLTHTIDALGGVTRQTYDAEDRVTSTQRFATAVSTAGFGDVVTSISVNPSASDLFTQRVFDRDGRERFTVSALGEVTERTLDTNGNVVRVREYAKAIAVGTYTSPSEVLAVLTADTNDRVTWMAYNVRGQKVFGVNSVGAVTEHTYDAAGNVTREFRYANPVSMTGTYSTTSAVLAALTSSAGDQATWRAYDSLGRMSFQVDAAGAVTQYAYDARGNVTATTEFATLRPTNLPTDLASLQTWAASNVGEARNRTTRYWFDSLDRVRFTMDPEGYLTQQRYDDAARTQFDTVYAVRPTIAADATLADVVTAADAIASSTRDQLTTTLHDALDRVVRVTDAIGNFDAYTYDAVGNRITHRNRKESVWNYEYDALGRLTREIAPAVSVTTVTESGAGLSFSTTDNMRIETVMRYDTFGNVIERTEAANIASQRRTTKYSYDKLGRQVRIDYAEVGVYDPASGDTALGAAGASVPRSEIRLSPFAETAYDALGNAFRNRDIGGNYSFKVYDRLGRVKYEIDARDQVSAYDYDAFGNQVGVTRYANTLSSSLSRNSSAITEKDVTDRLRPDTSADRTITQTFDGLNRVTEVRQPQVHNYLTTAAGQSTELMAGAVVKYEYDAFGMLVRASERTGVNSYADTWFYYDRRCLKIAEVNALKYATRYAYDAFGNLTRQVEYSRTVQGTVNGNFDLLVFTETPAIASPTNQAEGYDRVVESSYDPLNRKISETQVGVKYSAISGITHTYLVGDKKTTYRYDAVGNQTSVTVGDATTYNYYDALGRSIAVTEAKRNRGDGTMLTPLTLMGRDALGNVVERRALANGASSVSENVFTSGAESQDDRLTRMRLDSLDRVVQTEESLDGSQTTNRHASYNARGDLKKEWQLVNNGATDETRVTLYEYDELGRRTAVKQAQRYDETLNKVVLATTRSTYNSFGEVTSTTIDDLPGNKTTYFDYDNAGRVWRTNSEDGVDKVYLYDLLGNATAVLKSRFNSSTNLRTPANAAAAYALGGTLITETVYNALGQITEQRQPTFTVANPVAPIDGVRIDNVPFFSGHSALSIAVPSDVTLITKFYIDDVERSWAGIIEGSQLIVTRLGVDLTALVTQGLLSSGTHNYRITQHRLGAAEDAPIASTSGTFNVDATTSIVTTERAVLVPVSNLAIARFNQTVRFTWQGTLVGGTTVTSAKLELFVNGQWQTYTPTFDPVAMKWQADVPLPPLGAYAYRITHLTTYGATHAIVGVGRGTLFYELPTSGMASSSDVIDEPITNLPRDDGGGGPPPALPKVWITAPTNIDSFEGFANLGGGWFGWTTPPVAGSTLEFRWKPLFTANWSGPITNPEQSGGYYRVWLGGLPPGPWEFEVRSIAGDGAPNRVGSGRVTIGSSVSASVTSSTNPPPSMQVSSKEVQTLDRWGNVLTLTKVIQGLQDAVWTYRYNQNSQLITIAEPSTEVVLVNPGTGAITTTTTSALAVSRNFFDLLGRQIGALDGNGNLSQRIYNQAGQVIADRSADNRQTSYVYNMFGEQIQITDPGGFRTRQRFDRAGRLVRVAREIDPNVFDPNDVTNVPNFSVVNNGVQVKQYTYNQAGDRLSESTGEVMDDGSGNPETRRYIYDRKSNIIRNIDPMGGFVEFGYDALGHKTSEKDANGWEATWSIDAFGHLLGHKDFGGTIYAYNYDANRTWLLTSQTSSDGQNWGQHKDYFYDDGNHLTRIVDTGRDVNRDTQYRYDAAARIATQITIVNGLLHEHTRTYYDPVGRIAKLYGRGFKVFYGYDLADNRTRIDGFYATGASAVTGQLSSQGLRYRYDAMNRVTRSEVSNGAVTLQTTDLTYNERGMRASANTAGQLSTYSYDGLGLLDLTRDGGGSIVEDRDYDRALRATRLRTATWSGVGWDGRVTDTSYNDNGWVNGQTISRTVNNGPWRTESSSPLFEYDSAGNLLRSHITTFDSNGNPQYNSNHTYTYRRSEGYQEASHHVDNSAVLEDGFTATAYNANGEQLHLHDSNTAANSRYFANSAQGNPLTVVKGNYGTNPDNAFRTALGWGTVRNEANAGYFFYSTEAQQVGSFTMLDSPVTARINFDVNYTPVSPTYPASVPSSYVTAHGDTLRLIAAKVFGDPKLWYIIAQANGLFDPDTEIPDGRTLEMPSLVTSLSNSANVFKPFDIKEAIGDTTPTQPPVPVPPAKKGCGILGTILMIAVAVVATVFTVVGAGIAAKALGISTAAHGGIFGTGVAALGGQLGAVGAASAAIGGAAGSFASQGFAIATGVQQDFNWLAVGSSALGATLGAGLGAVKGRIPGFNAVSNAATDANRYLGAAFNAAAGNVLTQGAFVATRLQPSFEWQRVASAAVTAPISSYVSPKVGSFFGSGTTGRFASDLAGAYVSAGVSTAFVGGKLDPVNVAANAFGDFVGNAIVDQLTAPPPRAPRPVQLPDVADLSKLPLISTSQLPPIDGFPSLAVDDLPPPLPPAADLSSIPLQTVGPALIDGFPAASPFTYQLVDGDTILGLAGGDSLRAMQIMERNRITNARALPIGMELNLDTDGVVVSARTRRAFSRDIAKGELLKAQAAAAEQAATRAGLLPGWLSFGIPATVGNVPIGPTDLARPAPLTLDARLGERAVLQQTKDFFWNWTWQDLGQSFLNAVPGGYYANEADRAFGNGRYVYGTALSVAALADAGLSVFTLGTSSSANTVSSTTRAAVNGGRAAAVLPDTADAAAIMARVRAAANEEAQARMLVEEAAQATGIRLSDSVDQVLYGVGDSWFGVIGGKRTITIGSEVFAAGKTDADMVIEALHEVAHSRVYDSFVRRVGESAARGEYLLNPARKYGMPLYAREEVIVETWAQRRYRSAFGPFAEEQAPYSTSYIPYWRDRMPGSAKVLPRLPRPPKQGP